MLETNHQIGHPATINTDASAGFPATVNQSEEIALDLCEAGRPGLLPLEGNTSKGHLATKSSSPAQRGTEGTLGQLPDGTTPQPAQ